MLGIDLVMEKNGKIQTIQCKKVWNIEKISSTLMNVDEGAFRVTGKPYISKQRNVDLVGYGTLDGKGIVALKDKGKLKELEMNLSTQIKWYYPHL